MDNNEPLKNGGKSDIRDDKGKFKKGKVEIILKTN